MFIYLFASLTMKVCNDDKIHKMANVSVLRDNHNIHKPLQNYGRLFSFHIYNPHVRDMVKRTSFHKLPLVIMLNLDL